MSTYPPQPMPPLVDRFRDYWTSNKSGIPRLQAFSASFFFLGLLNNVLYVVILSAALDLVDSQSTPKGAILFFNIGPALLVKIGWPYFVRGQIQYAKRIIACSLLSFAGILIISLSNSLMPRLFGISIASFSSGLGEMTYLQLTTVYNTLSGDEANLGGIAVGWFSSGTGAAGLVGAGLWWILRGLGVRLGLLICSVLPLCMTLTYYCLLPSLEFYSSHFTAYVAVPNDEEDVSPSAVERAVEIAEEQVLKDLTTAEKIKLAKPLVLRYMLPLFFVYLGEYTINQGVAPTLIYQVPTNFLGSFIKNLRDYYPLWQLVYQTFVFFSRSSLSIFKLKPLPRRLIALPSIFQMFLFLFMYSASGTGFIENTLGETGAIYVVFLLVALEGLAGGTAYVNAFYHLGREDVSHPAEKEFKIASVGFADTLGILVASFVASAVEPALCSAQQARGRLYCKEL